MLRNVFVGSVLLCVAFACSSEDSTGSHPEGDCSSSKCASEGGAGGEGGGDSTTPKLCKTDAECDDSEFCNGKETCAPEDEKANSKGCVVAKAGPCTEACDESADECLSCDEGDVDKDGHKAIACDGDDCDDNDKDRYPGNEEVCDDTGHDEDCDYTTLGGPKDADTDKDEFVAVACCNTQKNGDLLCGTDCDDTKQGINPGHEEACNGIDDNCDGIVDGDTIADDLKTNFYVDKDGDDFGDPASITLACVQPDDGWILNAGDCADDPAAQPLAASIRPDAQEKCNGVDDDCDGKTDAADDSLEAAPTNVGTDYVCEDGEWKITKCPANKLHCDDNVQNGCETDSTTLSNCRSCGQTCSFACGATACVEVTALAGGGNHSCALTSDGGAACWGQNTDGRLGDASTTQRLAPRAVSGGLTSVTQLSLGAAHSCAIAAPTSTLYCWGSNGSLRIGNNTVGASVATPTPVKAASGGGNLTNVVSVAAGSAHTCAALSNGHAACWGESDNGRLGAGEPTVLADTSWSDMGPLEIISSSTFDVLTNVKRVVAGAKHSCALTIAGTVECWGDNGDGQLGAGTLAADPDDPCTTKFGSSCASYTHTVAGLANVLQLTAGDYHTCALVSDGTGDGDSTDGTVTCWGSNGFKQLGQSSGASYSTPQAISGLANVKAVAAGSTSTCALLTNGDVQCWGSNDYGQRGDASAAATQARTTIALSEDASSIAAGSSHVCALGTSGRAWCWGRNHQGQLGNSTTSTQATSQPQNLSPLN